MERITIKEIAKRAGVSIGTVDRVLHNRGEVSKKTIELVEKIANEGNYQANVIARGLRMKQKNKIAILLPDDNEYWRALLKGINMASEEVSGFGISVTSFVFDRHNSNSFIEKANAMLAFKPDGVIMAPLLEKDSLTICKSLEAQAISYLFVDSNLDLARPMAFIGQDSHRGGYLAAKMLTLGYPNGCPIYIARIDDFDSMNKTIDERVSGLKQYIEDNSSSNV